MVLRKREMCCYWFFSKQTLLFEFHIIINQLFELPLNHRNRASLLWGNQSIIRARSCYLEIAPWLLKIDWSMQVRLSPGWRIKIWTRAEGATSQYRLTGVWNKTRRLVGSQTRRRNQLCLDFFSFSVAAAEKTKNKQKKTTKTKTKLSSVGSI